MIITIVLSAITCILMILAVLFLPKIKLGKIALSSYWVVTLLGALTLILLGLVDVSEVTGALLADTAINPLKILVLFISMTLMSIFLDELGFFRYLASVTLKKAKNGQFKLFLYLYLTVSVLTVFTSNDIIVLSFTPFICYFAKNAKINAIPYLAAEFVAANTWSMALIIGNPTNIYLSTALGIGFVDYLGVMIVPTIIAGATAFGMLCLVFGKHLRQPISGEAEDIALGDKTLLIVGIAHLAICTLLLAIGSYINIEMWLVSLFSVVSLVVVTIIISIVRRERPTLLANTLRRGPYELIPFVLSMFVIIVALDSAGVTTLIAGALGEGGLIFKYGVTSFIASNLINNIPMSVLFSSILSSLGAVEGLSGAVFATVIGSNLGAFMTPIGALAGIMWGSILNEHGHKFGYLDFLKIGVTIAIPTLIMALVGLSIVL
ncbi:MAG: hypothetical protein J6Q52_04950 [Clostridia bacterium]|nr:hypothetical protein [Clostridia bacterium]